MARTSRAFSTVARIFALLRITRLSFSTAAISAGCIAATCAGSKPWNACRMPSHLASTARQVLEEERGIVRCVVAELLEWRGQLAHLRSRRRLIGLGRVPGPYPRDER